MHRLPSLHNALSFVDPFGGGPASDFDAPGQADSGVARLRAIGEELKAGLKDLERILRG